MSNSESRHLEVTVTVVYRADPVHYGTSDPSEMAAIDLRNFQENPREILDLIQDDSSKRALYDLEVTEYTPRD